VLGGTLPWGWCYGDGAVEPKGTAPARSLTGEGLATTHTSRLLCVDSDLTEQDGRIAGIKSNVGEARW